MSISRLASISPTGAFRIVPGWRCVTAAASARTAPAEAHPDQPSERGGHPYDIAIMMGGLAGVAVGLVVMAVEFGILLPVCDQSDADRDTSLLGLTSARLHVAVRSLELRA